MPKKVGKQIVKSSSDTFEIYLGTFIDNAFTWYSIAKYKDATEAYKEFKKYVNTQLKYTDEELKQVWDTGRLDIELRQGNKLLNWVGIYSREVKSLSEEEEAEAEEGKPGKKKEDSVNVDLQKAPVIDFTPDVDAVNAFTNGEYDVLSEEQLVDMINSCASVKFKNVNMIYIDPSQDEIEPVKYQLYKFNLHSALTDDLAIYIDGVLRDFEVDDIKIEDTLKGSATVVSEAVKKAVQEEPDFKRFVHECVDRFTKGDCGLRKDNGHTGYYVYANDPEKNIMICKSIDKGHDGKDDLQLTEIFFVNE